MTFEVGMAASGATDQEEELYDGSMAQKAFQFQGASVSYQAIGTQMQQSIPVAAGFTLGNPLPPLPNSGIAFASAPPASGQFKASYPGVQGANIPGNSTALTAEQLQGIVQAAVKATSSTFLNTLTGAKQTEEQTVGGDGQHDNEDKHDDDADHDNEPRDDTPEAAEEKKKEEEEKPMWFVDR
eukprot:CAMPEP_0197852736 /NCGR_PEP_ID=MMETSP1438-20131217/21284_1 /TAXON_ID=1461541 /ORGANISM="Pterosperma sp., Strain CCMP1384" /LENGTH=182 /DNA_ID=CAMNT_0043466897 /DNA_START=345 /DNA_END=890 /DNA_ORIENTATION=-